jgi:asparagine synthase (glutamine-hydrolysing)
VCGICGFTGPPNEPTLRSMMAAMQHRGPDAEGSFEADPINLGHRRLSVIDLETGDQPIFNEDHSVCVICNGEIYNFQALRQELRGKGHAFRTKTDTEVLVHLYEEKGLNLACYLNGMFAFALWDAKQRRLILCRDQVGIKPLFYAEVGGELVFASEVKAILRHKAISARLNRESAHLLLNLRYVPGPRTLFEGVVKLPAGHQLVWHDGKKAIQQYWTWPDRSDELSEREAIESFSEVLKAAVKRQMVSDVPLGLFLSGGLDSSAIAYGASSVTSERLRTFSIGFNEPTDELEDADRVARHFGTEHRAERLSPDPLREYPRVIYHVEEPKVNSLQGYILSRFARRHVTVALSGMGGDEVFVGYDLFHQMDVVRRVRRMMGFLVSPLRWIAQSTRWFGMRIGGLPFENVRRGLELLSALDAAETCYLVLRNAWDINEDNLRRIYLPDVGREWIGVTREIFSSYFSSPTRIVEDALAAEFAFKMVDDFLTNEDRVSMAHSLELRVPFLDRELIEWARRIPFRVLFRGGALKYIVKRALAPVLPPETMKKPKWGFTFNPYLQFRKDLRHVAAQTLTRERVERLELVRPEFIQAILDHRPTPLMRWHYFFLWTVMGLVMWQDIFEDNGWRRFEGVS